MPSIAVTNRQLIKPPLERDVSNSNFGLLHVFKFDLVIFPVRYINYYYQTIIDKVTIATALDLSSGFQCMFHLFLRLETMIYKS